MKRIIGIVFSCITILGCSEKNSVVLIDPPPVVVQPKVELTITPTLGVVPYGDTIKISWSSTDAKSVTLNNEYVGLSGSKKVRLFENTKYSILAVNGNLSATNEKSVTVGDWMTSDFGQISHKYWMTIGLRFIQNGIITNLALTDADKIEKTEFRPDGRVFDNGGFSCQWSIPSHGRILVGPQDCIYVISVSGKDTTFVRSFAALQYGNPATAEIRYGRHQ